MWMHYTQHDSILHSIKEIEESSDRAAGIVAAAVVEDHLTTVLKGSFHNDEQMIRDLFQGSGPLAPFSTKIKLAFLIGLLSARACKDLQTVRKIRNEFAHKLGKLTFETQNINGMAMSLTLPDWYNITFGINPTDDSGPVKINLIDAEMKEKLGNPRHRYITTCRCFLAIFSLEPPPAPPTPRV